MNRTAENMTDAITYLSLVVDHVNSNKTVSHTAKQISKQAGCAVAGTVVGGVLAGPIGAAVGSVVGAGIGLSVSDKYDGVLQKLLKLSEDEQFNLVQEIRNLVGENPIVSFYIWYTEPSNQAAVQTLLITAVGLAAAATQSSSMN
ncbi:hypothetical protein L5515_018122 [Caenorhabditis briggsae]|uniref:Uncharacterized protein n=1 Tax=Caenorhabditis briggsae TaxID=6238 RepID=A0AAE9FF09_CAEBR|nr:hypothetical protein L3Y34_012264 [Caenorhabditis briggsae]UMM42197.1 hypothetical protein L5515_018122 [Caenorhabditis briggsae]